ncbi:[FeFe] hydrogenase, group A [Clostridioides difficile]|uniref:[FeFe] hydrogenase, group A n=1 Tax=Clostridioides difficile TaxID=1496 RepID=UPI00038CA861|nr:[FeFe] hydrogenase, group A [Clostridioides difficile]OFU11833.1 iron hydrogenase [Clostridium sp. HMSC19C11]EIS9437417.1 iron hydrogenase small subunit [Clostridioides difficile]EIS9460644.1 iron hydrogenase small subunit [Clostridioides difficile]EIS9621279.1 iron hydrogenase small subunit [Clostridioides difficile]EIS9629921.1 iron hydrogenase small subunit [Clostridioides difficile]
MIINIDKDLCTGCRECSKVCPVNAIEGEEGKPQEINLDRCVMCGQCVQTCKSYASVIDEGFEFLQEKKQEREIPESINEPIFAAYNVCDIDKVKKALSDPNVFTMVQCAPAVRVALGEDFGYYLGYLGAGKMAAALRALNFDRVYDTNFAADLTIMEEGSELIKRVTEGGILPMFTSCCPAWVKFMEKNYPKLTNHLSSCKSPQQMGGAIFKTYGAEINNVDASKIFSVSIMPCTCKKYECDREEMDSSGYRDVDVVLTTRELAYLIKDMGIDFKNLREEKFDSPLGSYSGAGTIFGVTGGVMEAAIRTGYELITGESIPDVEVKQVRGENGFRKSTIKIGDLDLRVGVVSGLKNVIPVLEDLEKGKLDVDFIEVMTCPVGCVSGGGQPKILLEEYKELAYENRTKATYVHDEHLAIRKSHENPDIKKLYDEYLVEPLGEKSHHLLHTTYCIGKEVAK